MKRSRILSILACAAVLALAMGLTACSSSSGSSSAAASGSGSGSGSAAATSTSASAASTSAASASASASAASGSAAASSAAAASANLVILYEQDDSLINNYSLLAVNPEAPFVDADGNAVADVKLNTVGAKALIDWMLSEGLDLAGKYGVEEYGEALFYIKDDAPRSTAEIPQATDETKVIRLSTTTSVNDSGLLDALLPVFKEKYGYEVEVYSAGTGKAIANAKMGNADLILVHAKAQEESFIADGFSYVIDGQNAERLNYMYNFFVICGPSDDPAGIKSAPTAKDAFKMIADGKYKFVSRGDKSGTHIIIIKI